MINAEEGGVCGRKFQLYIRDDGGDNNRDKTEAKELASEPVKSTIASPIASGATAG